MAPPTDPQTETTTTGNDPERTGHTVTALLERWNEDPKEALDEILPRVAAELRRMAASFLVGEESGHTLQPTALVHELYLRLLDRRQIAWQDRSHFFGFAARTMRRILVDHARAKRAAKRGGGETPLALDEVRDEPDDLRHIAGLTIAPDLDLVALDLALAELETLSPRQHQIVEWHVFAGLTFDQIADILGLGNSTVRRDWATARAWLYDRMHP